MNKGWTTTKLIAIGGLAALNTVCGLMASTITLATGIMMASGVLTSFIGPILLVLTTLLVDKRGSSFIFLAIAGFLEIPLALSGPPGFLPKALIFVCWGILAEIIYASFKKYSQKVAVMVLGGVEDVFLTLAVITVGTWLGIPGVETIKKFISPPVLVALFLVGCLSGYLGYLIYQKIKDTTVARRIQL